MVHRLRDVVIVIPGITGSVLAKDGREIWSLSGKALWSALKTLGQSLSELKLTDDPVDVDDVDGVQALRVFEDFHLVPGLHKVDGYSQLVAGLQKTFRVKRGNLAGTPDGNLLTFPYDWRRDNRVAARQLERFAGDALRRWRAESGASDAQVIFVAHSMGGLVARYFLEVLGGWRSCRALITFGTPHRGSLNAVNFLANGYKQLFVDLTDVLRSCTSIYQLLPIYPAIDCGGEYKRVTELQGLPGIDATKAARGLEFHREIERAVATNRKDATYLREGYCLLPFVGVDQPTLQAARWDGMQLIMERALPSYLDSALESGDGVVPRCSATPVEMSDAFRETFHAERHGSLQSNFQIVADVLHRIQQMQVSQALKELRGSEPLAIGEQRARLSVDVDDAYRIGEPVRVRAQLSNRADPHVVLDARIDSISGDVGDSVQTAEMRFDGAQWFVDFVDVPRGVHRLTVCTEKQRPVDPSPVHDIFEVVGE